MRDTSSSTVGCGPHRTAALANAPDARRRLAQTILAGFRSEAELVSSEHRNWWLAYLESHSRHILTLLELTDRTARRTGVIADVGSFPGHFAALLKEIGYDVAAVDLAPERAADFWACHEVACWRCDVESDALPFDSESIEVVVLAEVLEHLRINPFRVLEEAHRSLRPGGHIILSVPNVSPRHRIRFFLGRDYQGDIIAEYRSLREVGHMGHFRLFSHKEIHTMLTHVGFEVRESIVTGWLPRGRWSFVKYFGPFRNSFRSHLYVIAGKRSEQC